MLKNQHRALLRGDYVIVICTDACACPIAIVKIGVLKACLAGAAIVGFEKLRLIAARAALGISRVQRDQKAFIAAGNTYAVHQGIAKQTVAVVAALPDAIDQSLIQRVHRNDVFALDQIRRQVNFIVIILKMVRRSRPLCDKGAVYVQHIVVIRRDQHARMRKFLGQRKGFAEKHVSVSVFGAI